MWEALLFLKTIIHLQLHNQTKFRMKKLKLTILPALLLCLGVNAQSLPCGNSSPSACSAVPLAQNGFENPDSIECFEQGVNGEVTVQFKNFTNLVIPGTGPVTVYYMRIDSILNLPCGVCWSTNKANNVFAGGEDGCIKFSGTTTDQVGQYKLKLILKAQITQGSYNPQALIDPPGGLEPYENTIPNTKLYAKVKASGSTTCANVDTSATANNKVGNPAACQTGIDEISHTVNNLKIIPSHVNASANVQFLATENSNANVFVTDISGRTVWSKTISSTVGENNFTFERNGIANGLYLMTITVGKSQISKRFNVIE